jgi:hypothetical protein
MVSTPLPPLSVPAVEPGVVPEALPPIGSAERWPWLQDLRRRSGFDLEPWLRALETGGLELRADLLTVLAERLNPDQQLRLLRCWRRQPHPDAALPELLARDRHPATAAWLHNELAAGPAAMGAALPPPVAAALLPLLGHQRQPSAWPLLQAWLRAPIPLRLRQAALDGVARGLSAWPRQPLAGQLAALSEDLDPCLAAAAVDLLARLPAARTQLLPLRRRPLDAAVAARLDRRLAALPVQPLLLVVHGRSGGVLPPELIRLAAALEQRRGAPVRIQALTAPAPPDPADLVRPGVPLGLVPLLLLPGAHVRHDIPAVVAHWSRLTAVRRLPFLGAWPAWQRALREEVAALAAPVELWHHPLEGPLAGRYLRHLERFCAARCRPAAGAEAGGGGGSDPSPASVLPLTLAANRLTEALEPRLGAAVAAPLLARPRLVEQLLALLEALP